MSEPTNQPDLDRARELTLRKYVGLPLSAVEVAELSEILGSSAEARTEYWHIVSLHSALEWELGNNQQVADALFSEAAEASRPMDEMDDGQVVKPTHATSSAGAWMWLAAAACLLLTATTARVFWRSQWPSSESIAMNDSGMKTANHAESSSGLVLGTVTPLTQDSHWTLGHPGSNRSSSFRAGDTIWLEKGKLELQLATSGTTAILKSPAIMQFVAIDRVRVMRGSVKIDVAAGDEGFSVETDSAEVIDLGTVFSVNVQNGNTDVIVFDGEVDLKPAHSSAKMPSTTMRFRAGEAVQVAQDGTLSRIVNICQTDDSNYPLITSVTDNNHRSDHWSFYEIVPEGFGEDAAAFVDRRHEWNGIGKAGIPSYLMGADYVKTFNDDKVSDGLSINVTLSSPATLYILLDMRVAPPAWLLSSFEDTGDKLGIDEVPFMVDSSTKNLSGRLGAGAGQSIDRYHSIWKLDLPTAGAVVLGANGRLVDGAPEGASSRANMYGVVAVPHE